MPFSNRPEASRETTGRTRVLLVAGGTGGHIAPALAVGSSLRAQFGDRVTVRYMTGNRPIEKQAFEAAHEFPDTLACESAPRFSLREAGSLSRYASSVFQAIRHLRKFRPNVILATGGYVCAPVLAAARVLRIPFMLHESNAIPGRVTRMFAKTARQVYVAHAEAAERLGIDRYAVAGTPVRETFFATKRDQSLARFQFEPGVPTVLILGGSQGAHALNEAVLDMLPHFQGRIAAERLQIVWACGPLNHKSVSERLERLRPRGIALSLHPFLDDIHHAYAAADLVISRAGASTLAEITALGLPSILIPYPHAKDDHQRANARALADAEAAIVIEEANLAGERLARLIGDLFVANERLERMAVAARQLGAPGCAERIAKDLMNIEAPAKASATKPDQVTA